MKNLTLFVVSTGIALIAAACGGDDGGGGGGGGGSLANASDAFKAAFRESCDKAHECKDSYDASMHNGDTFESSWGTSADECYNMTLALIEQYFGANYFDEIDASADAGRIAYDEADAQTCLDAASSVSCDAFFEQNGQTATEDPACDTAIQGTVATGGTCTTDFDCMSDADSCTDGTCTAG